MQGSLFDLADVPAVAAVAPTRRHLDAHTWVDEQAGLVTGTPALLDDLLAALSWTQGTRVLFGERVTEPRLSGGIRRPSQHPVIAELARALSDRYRRRFDTVFCNRYRDGDDAVAWHRDRIHRSQRAPLVAIVTVGATRRFLLRPRGGGASVRLSPASGDLLVMGGRSQHDWEHAVPRTARPVGERISVTLRPSDETP